MMYATHKAGGALFALVGFEVLAKNNMLQADIEPWLQLILMYPACSFGSTFPDLDHHWGSVKEHTPVNWLIHKIIHITQPKHRSWQTHSILVTGGLIALMFSLLYATRVFGWFNLSAFALDIVTLLITGLSLGIASHLFLDTFTRAGIWLVPGIKMRLVPNSEKFSTDTTYESIVRAILYVLTGLMLIWVLNPFGLQEGILTLIGVGNSG